MEKLNWINTDLVQSFLGESDGKVTKFVVESATKSGDNFLSNIYRLKVTTTSGSEISLIMKFEDPTSLDLISVLEAFPKEVVAYKDYLPAFEGLWEASSGEKVSFGPACNYTTTDPVSMIVMEDLIADGCSLRDRKVGLDSHDIRVLFSKVAKYHACSVKYSEENGPFDQELFSEGVAREPLRDGFQGYYGAMFEQFVWCVENSVDNGAQYVPQLLKLRNKQFDTMQELTRSNPDKFNVLCHADLWINNLMFHGGIGESSDVKFIDFQISQWSSPVVDLIFILFTSCQAQVIVEEGEDLVKLYHSELVKCLETLKCKKNAPSLEDIQTELKKRGALGVIYMTESLALSKAETGISLSLETLAGDSEESQQARKELFSSKGYVKTVNMLLPYMEKMGYLNMD